MKNKELISQKIRKLKAYRVESIAAGEIKLDAQENPYDLDKRVRSLIDAQISRTSLNRYPDPRYRRLKKQVARYCGVSDDNILVGNGSDELIMDLFMCCGGPGRTAVFPEPTFSMYRILSDLTDTRHTGIKMDSEFRLPWKKIVQADPDIVFIAYPNNPTGNCFSRDKIIKIIEQTDALVVVDEAYYEFSGKTFVKYIKKYKNLVVLRTFSKAFSLAGIRCGYIAANNDFLKQLRKVQLPYNMSILNQKILQVVMEESPHVLKSTEKILESRSRMYSRLKKIPSLTLYPSDANFILMKLKNIDAVLTRLKKNRIAVRKFSSADLQDHLRVTIGTEEENESFLSTLETALRR
ncbi:histidinol-phosphate transaminase [Elusimicrobiota bacterium]